MGKIIGFIVLYNFDSNDFPFELCAQTLDFVDELLIFCGSQREVFIAEHTSIAIPHKIIELGGEMLDWGHIALQFNRALEWIRKERPTADIIVKSDADIYLNTPVKKSFIHWMNLSNRKDHPFYIPVMRHVLYSRLYENYHGFVAFENDPTLRFILDGAYLNRGGGYDRAALSEEIYALDLGQIRPIQTAKKLVRNQIFYRNSPMGAALAGRYLKGKESLEDFLKGMRPVLKDTKDWEEGSVNKYLDFIHSSIGQKFIEHYESDMEVELVGNLIWR